MHERPRAGYLLLAGLGLPLVALSLRLGGFERTRARLAGLAPRRRASGASAEAIARAVGVAARLGPWRGSCLPRALVLWTLLRRAGIQAALRIGARRGPPTFAAHAWVEVEGRVMGESASWIARYAAFDRDFGQEPRA